jgi:hemin uptake protein HemP
MTRDTPEPTPPVAPPPARDPAAPAAVRIDSARLFAGAAEVQIEHRGALYRLKQTSLGKLILTK